MSNYEVSTHFEKRELTPFDLRREAMLLGKALGLSPDLLASILNTSVRIRSMLERQSFLTDLPPFSQTGKCWSSEINNPAPGALPNSPTPADRGYTGG